MEEKVRDLVKSGNVVYVMTGPIYEKDMPSLPGADEPHKIPSEYWKIIIIKELGTIKTAGFIFDQNTQRSAKVINHLVTIDEIEKRSILDFLWKLPDDIEEEIECSKLLEWAQENFNIGVSA